MQESKNQEALEEYREEDKTLKNYEGIGKWKYDIDQFMEFEIALLGNHKAIWQTCTKVSELELY